MITPEQGQKFDYPKRSGWRKACLPAVFFLIAAACGNLFAQENASGSNENVPESQQETSQQVDESEESYRARMELRDQRYREQRRADTIYSSQGGDSKLDQLPEASRENIKEQMRDMISASRQWKPGEDVSDYPYEPTTAAQTDAKLLSQEREAWAEQLQKYQEREAAAYANASGSSEGKQGGQENGDASQGSGSKGENNASAANSGSPGQQQEGQSQSSTTQSREMAGISTAGVSESALSFLQSTGGQGEAEGMQAQATGASDGPAANDTESPPGNPSDQAAPPGSIALSELAMLQGMSTDLNEAMDDPFAPAPVRSSTDSGAQQQPDEQSATDPGTQEEVIEDLEGTLIIADLQNMRNAVSPGAGHEQSGALAADPAQAVDVRAVEPGTLLIDELDRLDGN